jgi:hypothetical protein
MKKLLPILFFIGLLGQSATIEIQKSISKQFLLEEIAERNPGEIHETAAKFLSSHSCHLAAYLFYLNSKEKFAHFHRDPKTECCLDTFSPPPEHS